MLFIWQRRNRLESPGIGVGLAANRILFHFLGGRELIRVDSRQCNTCVLRTASKVARINQI